MLTRAVRRRRNLRLCQNAAERIQLPWLCPALWSSHTTCANIKQDRIPVRLRVSRGQTACLSTNTRKLAAAAATPSLFDSKLLYPHFEYKDDSSQRTLNSTKYDLSHILLLDHTTTLGPVHVGRAGKSSVRGSPHEIEATLDACLQIKQWNRSMTILEQLCGLYAGDIQKLQRLYNKVLDAMVFDHIWNRSAENISEINGWVENVMKKADVPPNAETFALKIKAAMATLQGSKRDRTVRRYWNMAKEYNVDWEVASLRDILSDHDLGKLSEISPLQYENEPEEVEAEDNISVSEGIVSQPNLPDVRATPQKGLGMYALKQSLSLFSKDSRTTEWSDIEHADPAQRREYMLQRQMHLERDALTSATERWKIEHEKMQKMGVNGSLGYGKVGALMWTWQEKLTKSIKAELSKIKLAEDSVAAEKTRLRLEYGPFLRLLDPEVLAALTVTTTISTLCRLNVHYPARLAALVTAVGRTIEQEVDARMKMQKELVKKSRRSKEAPEAVTGPAPNILTSSSRVHWSIAQHSKVGSILCELLFDVAKISFRHELDVDESKYIEQLAFERKNIYTNGKRVGMIAAHSELIKILTKEPVADVLAKQLPMVCEPIPWTGFLKGGYIETENPVLRIKNVDEAQKEYTAAAAQRGDLDQIFKGLDVLGQTGWKINQEVFKVMLDAWNSGEAIANLPPLNKVFPKIAEPSSTASARERYEFYKSIQSMKNEQGGLHSNRCFQNFQMEIAKAYLHETFYLPHNVDFRGRAYPIPPYLNQMGADNARGLLLFAEGKPLGPAGVRWLKIHLSNLCGYDKASLSDRASYADQHMDDIRDSVQNPLNGRKWWLGADDPWQCLATCHELVKAIDSGNPEGYVSHLPIHQDGTCNGLQHYAALGGDIAGARQVNLEPGDRPADVYTGVAELVKAEIKKDARAGYFLATELDDRITRKIVKQTVMTNVYGVTFTGARLQVRKQIDVLLPDLSEKKLAGLASTYIAKKIFKGLGALFNGAHEIQYWLGDCASRITNSISPGQIEATSVSKDAKDGKSAKKSKKGTPRDQSMSERRSVDPEDFRSTVVWTTPLKLPVVQPYRVPKTTVVKTHMSSITLVDPHITDCVDKRKQLQGFPPNFVHSLDATHMMLSAIAAKEHGLTFSAVHDSFWTHAADIDTLNLLLRNEFVRMHTEDIVGRLAEEFKLRYKGHLYLAKVEYDSPVGRKIRDWRAMGKGSELLNATTRSEIRKQQRYKELKLEFQRQKLLASEDPEDVAKGKKMVTAASIFEKAKGERYLKSQNSLGETALGKIPESQQKTDSGAIEEALQNDEITEVHDVDMEATLKPAMQAQTFKEFREQMSKEDGVILPSIRSSNVEAGNFRSVPTWVWLPLTFKPVPKKGDWDVQRLKDSVYFFS